MSRPADLFTIARDLAREVRGLSFRAPVTHVYRPLDYAANPHAAYLERYGRAPREVLLLGMNPGPFGMAQTGVPFGDVGLVRAWLEIDGSVGRPDPEHPARPVAGFACTRSEVSGRRLWGWARERWGTPARFFARFFVLNYCPLAFLEASGKNRTPDRLPADEREPLFAACDRALLRAVEALGARTVVGIGGFAQRRAVAALQGQAAGGARGGSPRVVSMPHPSPASPAANRGWAAAATRALRGHGIDVPGS